MIPGYFRTEGPRRRPYIDIVVQFPDLNNHSLEISFLIDTGADHTLLSPFDGSRLREQFGVDLMSLPRGVPIGGVGGQAQTRNVRATLAIGDYSTTMPVGIVEPPPGSFSSMPSLLGRDLIYDFALFMQHRTDRVLFLDDDEADRFDFS